MKWKSGLILGLFLVGMAGAVYASTVGTGTMRNKPAGMTREQAMFEGFKDVINSNSTWQAQQVTPNSGSEAASLINTTTRVVDVQAVTNAATDFIVLPNITGVPIGHQIRVCSNAGGAYEIRTPASSGQLINTVNSDGTQEYLAVDAEIHVFTKVTDADGWSAYDIQAAGGIGGATTPD